MDVNKYDSFYSLSTANDSNTPSSLSCAYTRLSINRVLHMYRQKQNLCKYPFKFPQLLHKFDVELVSYSNL